MDTKRIKFRWTLYGILFGLFFPLMAFILGISFKLKPLFSIHFFIISTAPIVLGTAGYIIGSANARYLLLESQTRGIEFLIGLKEHVDFGVAVIDKNYNIKMVNSTFIKIFGESVYEGRSIFDTIFYGFTSKMKNEIKEFLNLCFENTTATDSALNDLSPFKKFIYPYNQNGKIIEKILETDIGRIFGSKNEGVKNLFFFFKDVTLEEKLKKDIEKKEREAQLKYQQIVALFSNDREVVSSFIHSLNDYLTEIKEKLKVIKQNEVNKDILNEILRIVHTVKGEAFSLGFNGIAEAAKNMEEYIKTIINNEIDLDKSLNLISAFEALQYSKNFLDGTLNQVRSLLENIRSGVRKEEDKSRISSFEDYIKSLYSFSELSALSSDKNQAGLISISTLKKELESVVNSSLKLSNKEAKLVFESTIESIPENIYRYLKEAFLHLIRNSIGHGIETPEERKRRNKNIYGEIRITISENNGNYEIDYYDDGNGFDILKIKEKAISKKFITPEEAKNMTNNEILNIVFKDGFSTKDEGDMVSGTGVGMSIIKDNIIKKLKGTLKIHNLPGKGVNFKITIPKLEN